MAYTLVDAGYLVSHTAGEIPTVDDLSDGQLAINTADLQFYAEKVVGSEHSVVALIDKSSNGSFGVKHLHLFSSISGRIPSSDELGVGQFAVNFPDKKVFTKTESGEILSLFNQAQNISLAELENRVKGDLAEVLAGDGIDINNNGDEYERTVTIAVRYGNGLTISGGDLIPDLGDGLFIDGTAIAVNLGSGLTISNDFIVPDLGDGLKIDTTDNNKIAVNLGDNGGLVCDGSGLLGVNTGGGLAITSNVLAVNLGSGLTTNGGSIVPDLGDGLKIDTTDANKIAVNLGSGGLVCDGSGILGINTGDGLEITSNVLAVKLDGTSSGLNLSSSGLKIKYIETSGLSLDTGSLEIKCASGIIADSNKLKLNLLNDTVSSDYSGLDITDDGDAPDQRLYIKLYNTCPSPTGYNPKDASGLRIAEHGMFVKVASEGGLDLINNENTNSGLAIKLKSNSGLDLASDGLSVPETSIYFSENLIDARNNSNSGYDIEEELEVNKNNLVYNVSTENDEDPLILSLPDPSSCNINDKILLTVDSSNIGENNIELLFEGGDPLKNYVVGSRTGSKLVTKNSGTAEYGPDGPELSLLLRVISAIDTIPTIGEPTRKNKWLIESGSFLLGTDKASCGWQLVKSP